MFAVNPNNGSRIITISINDDITLLCLYLVVVVGVRLCGAWQVEIRFAMKLYRSGALGVLSRCSVGALFKMQAPCEHQGAPDGHQYEDVESLVGTL